MTVFELLRSSLTSGASTHTSKTHTSPLSTHYLDNVSSSGYLLYHGERSPPGEKETGEPQFTLEEEQLHQLMFWVISQRVLEAAVSWKIKTVFPEVSGLLTSLEPPTGTFLS